MRLELGRLTVRDDPGSPRRVGGYGVLWGSIAGRTPEYGPEVFAPGAFRDALRELGKRPLPYLDRHDGEVIAVLRASEDATGLALDGELFDSPEAERWARRATAGIDGASIEFLPDPAGTVVTRDGVTLHKRVARLVAVAASYKPAHVGASLSVRDLETAMAIDTYPSRETRTPEPEPEPKPEPEPTPSTSQVQGMIHREIGELRRSLAEIGGTRTTDPYAALRSIHSIGELVHKIVLEGDTELHGIMSRALADELPADVPGLMVPSVLQDVKGIITRTRSGIESFGRAPLDGSGMSVDWPLFSGNLSTLVGEQVTPKSEITSVKIPITKGTAPIRTWGGGQDVAFQTIRRSSPAYLSAMERIYLAAYALTTDTAFVDAVEATAGLSPLVINWTTATQAQLQGAAIDASIKVKDATGEPASFILASATAFAAIGKALTPGPVFNVPGTSNAANLAISLSGLPVIYNPAVNAGTALISNSRAAAWHEDGPFFATETDVAKLGENWAVWGMAAAAVYIPAGIVKTSAT